MGSSIFTPPLPTNLPLFTRRLQFPISLGLDLPLMPGERRSLRVEVDNADTHGEKPKVTVGGSNTGIVTEK